MGFPTVAANGCIIRWTNIAGYMTANWRLGRVLNWIGVLGPSLADDGFHIERANVHDETNSVHYLILVISHSFVIHVFCRVSHLIPS